MNYLIIDFDGALTAEETQVQALSERSLDTLSNEILDVPRHQLDIRYTNTRAQLLSAPHRYYWEVNGLIASYCDEGAFILNTTTLQVMLRQDPTYAEQVHRAFPQAEYDPVIDCTNYLFHRHTAELEPAFRPAAQSVLLDLDARTDWTPVILTNSLGNKVRKQLNTLAVPAIPILGDTRQYDMDPCWRHHFSHPDLGPIQVWPISYTRQIDLRRPVYYRALVEIAERGTSLAVVADTLSLPGAVPLMMGTPFLLLRTNYTPPWCLDLVDAHPLGRVLDDLADLPDALDQIYVND